MRVVYTILTAFLVYIFMGMATRDYFAWSHRSWILLKPLFFVNDYFKFGFSQATMIVVSMIVVSIIVSIILNALILYFMRLFLKR